MKIEKKAPMIYVCHCSSAPFEGMGLSCNTRHSQEWRYFGRTKSDPHIQPHTTPFVYIQIQISLIKHTNIKAISTKTLGQSKWSTGGLNKKINKKKQTKQQIKKNTIKLYIWSVIPDFPPSGPNSEKEIHDH